MTSRPTRVIAFDPSIDRTGYAVLEDDGDSGRIWEAGLITTRDHSHGRAARIDDLIAGTQEKLDHAHADAAVIEFPFSRVFPGRGTRRSIATLPTMGLAIGAVYATARAHWTSGKLPLGVLTPGSDEWPRGTVPPTKGDDAKEARVRYVEAVYRLRDGELGPKTTAGNIADAILQARWGLWTLQAKTTHQEEEGDQETSACPRPTRRRTRSRPSASSAPSPDGSESNSTAWPRRSPTTG